MPWDLVTEAAPSGLWVPCLGWGERGPAAAGGSHPGCATHWLQGVGPVPPPPCAQLPACDYGVWALPIPGL